MITDVIIDLRESLSETLGIQDRNNYYDYLWDLISKFVSPGAVMSNLIMRGIHGNGSKRGLK